MRGATSAMGCESGAEGRSVVSRCLRPAHQAQYERGVARRADRLDRVGVGSGAPLGSGGAERREAGHVADRLGRRRDETVGKDIEIARDAENSAEPAQFVRKPAVFVVRQQRREGRQDGAQSAHADPHLVHAFRHPGEHRRLVPHDLFGAGARDPPQRRAGAHLRIEIDRARVHRLDVLRLRRPSAARRKPRADLLRRSSRIGATASMSSATSYSAVTSPSFSSSSISQTGSQRLPSTAATCPWSTAASMRVSGFGHSIKVWRAISVRTSADELHRPPPPERSGRFAAPADRATRPQRGLPIRRAPAPRRRSRRRLPRRFDGLDETSGLLADAQRQPLPRERAVRRIEIGGDQPRLPTGVATGTGQRGTPSRPAGIPAGSPVSVRSRSRSQPPGIAGKATELRDVREIASAAPPPRQAGVNAVKTAEFRSRSCGASAGAPAARSRRSRDASRWHCPT